MGMDMKVKNELIFMPSFKVLKTHDGEVAPKQNKKPRNSNIELLRIIAMLMILGVHANYKSIGIPNFEDINHYPLTTFFRVALEMICIISVNTYVFISGWFSIKVSLKGLCKFLYQVFFILITTYIIGVVIGLESLNQKSILQCFMIGSNAWFVKSYIALYILSPLLNKFCQTATKSQLGTIVLGFYIFQTIWGYSSGVFDFTLKGYSAFSFLGLYLLAQYVKRYGISWHKYRFSLFIIPMMLMILIAFFAIKFRIPIIPRLMLNYTNPINIIAALGLLLIFNNINLINNHIINYIASSCFAVYLFQDCISWTENFYKQECLNLFQEYNGITYFLMIICFILIVFFIGVFLDQFRKLTWKVLDNKIPFSKYQHKHVPQF